jgi:hypothetical protein
VPPERRKEGRKEKKKKMEGRREGRKERKKGGKGREGRGEGRKEKEDEEGDKKTGEHINNYREDSRAWEKLPFRHQFPYDQDYPGLWICYVSVSFHSPF